MQTGKAIYAALYRPPLQSPPKSEELPIAGLGYGSQTLPLVFDLVNIANGLPVEDAGKNKKKYLKPQGHSKPEEVPTVEAIKQTEKLVRRITGTHPASLGLHPGVYFYATNFRHQPTTVLAVAQLMADLEKEDGFLAFTQHRAAFENFLVNHKMFINQLTVRHGSMVKGFIPIRDYYRYVLDRLRAGLNETSDRTRFARSRYVSISREREADALKEGQRFFTGSKKCKVADGRSQLCIYLQCLWGSH